MESDMQSMKNFHVILSIIINCFSVDTLFMQSTNYGDLIEGSFRFLFLFLILNLFYFVTINLWCKCWKSCCLSFAVLLYSITCLRVQVLAWIKQPTLGGGRLQLLHQCLIPHISAPVIAINSSFATKWKFHFLGRFFVLFSLKQTNKQNGARFENTV